MDADPQSVRERCLSLAASTHHGFDGSEIVVVAQRYADFILGTSDGKILAAARALAATVK